MEFANFWITTFTHGGNYLNNYIIMIKIMVYHQQEFEFCDPTKRRTL